MTGFPESLLPLKTWLTDWPDPPWIMSGTTITAWFEPPAGLLAAVLGDELSDHDLPDRLARIRFYDVAFRGDTGAGDASVQPQAGEFREAVVAVPACAGDVHGEISVLMWTDSETYLAWGREVFGWPLRRAVFELDGSLWSGNGSRGRAQASTSLGTVKLKVAAPAASCSGTAADQAAMSNAEPVPWITPRRILYPAGPVTETIQITAVTPEVLAAGHRVSVDATVELAFAADHVLGGLTVTPVRSEIHSGFELLVGSTVKVVSAWER